MTKRGIFTSDFHMFTDRSVVESILPNLEKVAKSADFIVLGGDIVDFKWSRLPDQEQTELAAIKWLQNFSAQYHNKQIIYLIGNHDWAPSYLTRLNHLATMNSHVEIYKYWYRQGDALFLHGDVTNTQPNHDSLKYHRSNGTHQRKKGRLQNSLYSLIFFLRLPVLVNYLLNRNDRICKHLLQYLQNEGLLDGTIRRVFFGHTHSVINHFELEGLAFYNSGAPLKYLASEILQFEIAEDFSDGR